MSASPPTPAILAHRSASRERTGLFDIVKLECGDRACCFVVSARHVGAPLMRQTPRNTKSEFESKDRSEPRACKSYIIVS